MAYVLALPMYICEILMKFVIHILKALDISYTKMQEKIEITTNHLLQFWTKIPKNGYCDLFDIEIRESSQNFSSFMIQHIHFIL